jgi:hypothetical protein
LSAFVGSDPVMATVMMQGGVIGLLWISAAASA